MQYDRDCLGTGSVFHREQCLPQPDAALLPPPPTARASVQAALADCPPGRGLSGSLRQGKAPEVPAGRGHGQGRLRAVSQGGVQKKIRGHQGSLGVSRAPTEIHENSRKTVKRKPTEVSTKAVLWRCYQHGCRHTVASERGRPEKVVESAR